jgi:hypothetical protein
MKPVIHRRALGLCAIAAAWLLLLTALNLAAGGILRGTLLYAFPVALTACVSWRLGFLFAAIGTLSAWAGGAIPQPLLVEPLWVEGMWAFSRLSAVALGVHLGARHWLGELKR